MKLYKVYYPISELWRCEIDGCENKKFIYYNKPSIFERVKMYLESL
mgnify:CR=1 FL=1